MTGAFLGVLDKAISLHQMGRLAEAAERYRAELQQNPKNPDALHLLGVLELQRKTRRLLSR